MTRSALVALPLLAACLAACAPAEIRPQFTAVDFELSGRLAARAQTATGTSESFTGNVTWKHARDADEMLISTPLGQGVARIARQGSAVVLATAEPREYRATDAEALTEQVLGFRVPLTGLADWVRARPSTESPAHAEYAPDGRMLSLEQRGWKIEFQEYEGPRPVRLRMVYPGIELRLAITQWK
ncbi:MAG: lipoprotein insertase outer membrane protein LolB [Betaproteobacteria bacterium]